MNQPVTQVETTKILTDLPSKPKQKAATVIVFFLVAAAALFIAIAAFGIYTPKRWTAVVQQRTNEAARTLAEVVHPEKPTGMIRLQLPGQTMPYTDAPIFAHTSGWQIQRAAGCPPWPPHLSTAGDRMPAGVRSART